MTLTWPHIVMGILWFSGFGSAREPIDTGYCSARYPDSYACRPNNKCRVDNGTQPPSGCGDPSLFTVFSDDCKEAGGRCEKKESFDQTLIIPFKKCPIPSECIFTEGRACKSVDGRCIQTQGISPIQSERWLGQWDCTPDRECIIDYAGRYRRNPKKPRSNPAGCVRTIEGNNIRECETEDETPDKDHGPSLCVINEGLCVSNADARESLIIPDAGCPDGLKCAYSGRQACYNAGGVCVWPSEVDPARGFYSLGRWDCSPGQVCSVDGGLEYENSRPKTCQGCDIS